MGSGSGRYGGGSGPAPVVAFRDGVKVEPRSEMGETTSAMLAGTMLVASDEVSMVRIPIEFVVKKGGFWVRDCFGTSTSPVWFDIMSSSGSEGVEMVLKNWKWELMIVFREVCLEKKKDSNMGFV